MSEQLKLCVGCEGKPAAENNPCAVCGSAAPVGGVELPALPTRDGDWARDDWYTADSMRDYAQVAIAPYAERIRQLEAAYDAATFLAGDTINARNAEVAEQAARIRQLERELAERKTASIGNDPEFLELLANYCLSSRENTAETKRALIAYIDGRTAGAAPDGWHEAMARLCEDLAIHWQQDEGTYAAGKKAGALDCAEAIRAAAPTPMNSGKEEA